MVASKQRRASGETGAVEEAKLATEEMDQPVEADLPPDTPKYNFRTPKFSRMRLDWANSEERMVIERARLEVDKRILHEFPEVYYVLNAIYEIVRDPELDGNGHPRTDQFGYPIWKRTPEGFFIEDFNRLTRKQTEQQMGVIITRLFAWEQKAQDIWAEAMFAKSAFEERFAISYDAPMTGTVDDRKAAANKDAAEERYFAIYMTHLSRRSEALIRSMDRLAKMLKDTLVNG